ncbi:MAG: hypothetical protein ABEL97_11665 [Salinibacter sp.]
MSADSGPRSDPELPAPEDTLVVMSGEEASQEEASEEILQGDTGGIQQGIWKSVLSGVPALSPSDLEEEIPEEKTPASRVGVTPDNPAMLERLRRKLGHRASWSDVYRRALNLYLQAALRKGGSPDQEMSCD